MSNTVGQLPPTLSIKDPDVRQFADALVNILDLRSGNTNKDSPDRFLTARDFGNAIRGGVIGSGIGGGLGSGAIPGGPSGDGGLSEAIAEMTREIRNSLLYQILHTPIDLISPPEGLVQSLRYDIEAQVKVLKDGITDINDVSSTSKSFSGRTLHALKGTVEGANGLPLAQGYIAQMDDVNVTSTHASVNNMRGLMASVYDPSTGLAKTRADIAELNKIDATSTSALAQRVVAVSSEVGVGVKTFFQTDAPVSTPSYTLKIGDMWIDTDAQNAVYTWSGVAWSATPNSRIGGSLARVVTEENTRNTQTTALAQAIKTIWASVGGSSALIQGGQFADVTPAAVQATKWDQVQAEVIDPNTGNGRVTAIRSDMNAYISKTDNSLYSFYSVRAILPTGGTNVSTSASTATATVNATGSTTLYVSDTAGITAGMYVYGIGIPLGTTVSGVYGSTSLGITNSLKSPASGTYTFSTKKMIVGGIGLAAEGNGTSGTIDFGVSVDKFWVSSAQPVNDFEAYVDNNSDVAYWYSVNYASKYSKAVGGATHYYKYGQAEGRPVPTRDEFVPFIVKNSATYAPAAGIYYPPGVYIKSAFIEDASIGTAKISDASITTAKIGDLSVQTLKIADNAVTQALYAQTTYETWHSHDTPWYSNYVSMTIYPPTGETVIYPAKYLIVYSVRGQASGADTNLTSRIRHKYTSNGSESGIYQDNYESVSVKNGFTNLTTFMTLVDITAQCNSLTFMLDVGNDWSNGSMIISSGKMAVLGAKK